MLEGRTSVVCLRDASAPSEVRAMGGRAVVGNWWRRWWNSVVTEVMSELKSASSVVYPLVMVLEVAVVMMLVVAVIS